MSRLFTAGEYWFRTCAGVLVRNGDLNLTAEYWVLGLGSGFRILHRFLEGAEDVTGTAHVSRVHTGWYRDLRVTTIAMAGGGVYTEWVVALAWRRGVRALIGVGFCGALVSDLEVGDLILPLAAVRDEDTTRHYVPESYPAVADHRLLQVLEQCVRELAPDLRYRVGLVITTSSTFTEDREWGLNWSRHRVLGVDCEISVLYTLAYLAGIPAAGILVVSDHVTREIRYEDLRKLMEETVVRNYEVAVRCALETLHRYSQLGR